MAVIQISIAIKNKKEARQVIGDIGIAARERVGCDKCGSAIGNKATDTNIADKEFERFARLKGKAAVGCRKKSLWPAIAGVTETLHGAIYKLPPAVECCNRAASRTTP